MARRRREPCTEVAHRDGDRMAATCCSTSPLVDWLEDGSVAAAEASRAAAGGRDGDLARVVGGGIGSRPGGRRNRLLGAYRNENRSRPLDFLWVQAGAQRRLVLD